MKAHAPGAHESRPFERLRAIGRELWRRRVVHTGIWYSAGCAAFLQGAQVILQSLDVSTAILTPLAIVAIFGLPVALTLSWEFDVFAATHKGGSQRPAWLCLLPVLGVAALSALGVWAVWNFHFRRAVVALPDENVKPGKVAVLPFNTSSSRADIAALTMNLQKQLIDGLTDVANVKVTSDKQLRVVSWDGIKPYSRLPLDSIRKALAVPIVLTGDVKVVGDVVRVDIRLVDTKSLEQLAHRVVEKRATQNIALSDALGDSVLSLVRQELGVVVRDHIRRIETRSADAFNMYQLAMRRIEDATAVLEDSAATKLTYDEADGYLARAEKLDPRWVEPVIARADLAISRYIGESGWVRKRMPYVTAGIGHANRALHMRPNDYHALQSRGRLYFLLYQQQEDATAAEKAKLLALGKQDLLQSLASNPTPANCYRVLSDIASQQGQIEQALQYAKSAFDEDPYLDVRPIVLQRLFEYSMTLNRDADAERWCREGRSRFADVMFDDCRLMLAAWTSYGIGADSGAALIQHALNFYTGPPPAEFRARLAGMYAAILAQNGMSDSARAVMGRTLRSHPGSPGAELAAAGVYALVGMNDSALFMTRKLLDHKNVEDRGALLARPELRALRSNDSFQRLIRMAD